MYCLVYTMCVKEEVANKIANSLLEKKLIACANIVPGVMSAYWWEGAITRSEEVFVVMKTKTKLFDKVKNEIKKLHPYEVPEIICVEIKDGLKDYLNWIGEVTK